MQKLALFCNSPEGNSAGSNSQTSTHMRFSNYSLSLALFPYSLLYCRLNPLTASLHLLYSILRVLCLAAFPRLIHLRMTVLFCFFTLPIGTSKGSEEVIRQNLIIFSVNITFAVIEVAEEMVVA